MDALSHYAYIIVVFTSLLFFRGAKSSLDLRRRLCIPTNPHSGLIPTHRYACPKDFGILVDGIQMIPTKLNEDCEDEDSNEDSGTFVTHLQPSGPYKTWIQEIELAINKACNGKRQCDIISHFDMPSPLSLPNGRGHYKMYLILYNCLPTVQDSGQTGSKTVVDIAEKFTVRGQTGRTILVLNSDDKFDQDCIVRVPNGFFTLEPLWISFNEAAKTWDACLTFTNKDDKTFDVTFDVTCNQTNVSKMFSRNLGIFHDIAEFHVKGNSGFVWIRVSANTSYDISCKAAKQNTASRANDSDSSTTVIAITSTLAAVSTVIAICLGIYVCYLKGSSDAKTRKASMRLERQLTQRQQEGQHPRMHSPSHRSRLQQEQQQATVDASDEVYTYLDTGDMAGPSSQRHGALKTPGVHTTATPNNSNSNYNTANFDAGAYSSTYSSLQTQGPSGQTPGDYETPVILKNTPKNEDGAYSSAYFSLEKPSSRAQSNNKSPVAASGIPPINNTDYDLAKGGDDIGYSLARAKFNNTVDDGGDYNKLGEHKPKQRSGDENMYDTGSCEAYSKLDDVNKKQKVIGNFYDG